jgi:hypothetical protein
LGGDAENRPAVHAVARAIPETPPMLFRSAPEPPAAFPEVSGATLDGEPLVVPRDLRAEWNLLVVSFRDDLDALADRWVLLARRLAEGSGGRLDVYELPVVGKGWRVFRPLVHEAMRAQAEDADERARTVPLHLDRARFQKQLGVRDDGTVHAFLVARDGRIAWRGEGLLTPEQVAALERAVGETISIRPPAPARPAPEPDREPGEGLPEAGLPEAGLPEVGGG